MKTDGTGITDAIFLEMSVASSALPSTQSPRITHFFCDSFSSPLQHRSELEHPEHSNSQLPYNSSTINILTKKEAHLSLIVGRTMTINNHMDRHQDCRRRFLGTSMSLVFWASISCIFMSTSSAYTPDVNHRDIAGLWKLKQKRTSSSPPFPIKEFTVYPKVPKKRIYDESKTKEVLLMLKEDGSFQQYDQEQKAPDTLRFFDSQKASKEAKDDAILDRYCEFGKLKGKWELVGGKLILAADRPIGDNGQSPSMGKTNEEITDTILEGEVVATMEEGLSDNPMLRADDNGSIDISSSRTSGLEPPSAIDRSDAKSIRGGRANRNSVVDTHLSVPKGRVNVGRFTYPTHHPSFFEAPMFNPRAGGKFELKQVLGTLNTKQQKDEEDFKEKFSVSDFYNKTFLLTSHPIPEYQPKGNIRWSIKYNKFVGTCEEILCP